MKADINKIKEYEEYLSKVNCADLETIEFYKDDEKIDFNIEFLEDFKYRGLCNTDLILDEYFYEKALNKNNDCDFLPIQSV